MSPENEDRAKEEAAEAYIQISHMYHELHSVNTKQLREDSEAGNQPSGQQGTTDESEE